MVIHLILITLVLVSEAKITINVKAGKNISDTVIEHHGYDREIIDDKDIDLFNIDQNSLKEAVKNHYNAKPSNVYLKSPTPWGDLYKTHNWEQVSKILKVKSAKLKEGSVKTVLILSEDFNNDSDKPIKVNAGISQTVENTFSSSWSKSKEFSVSQEFEYDMNVIFAKISGTTSFSYTSSWGKGEEKSESNTMGTTTNVEIELRPGQTAVAVLSANKCTLEIEVEYVITLRGNVAVNYKRSFKGHHFYGPSINSILKSGGLETEKTVIETIRIGLFTDASLKVSDKETNLPL